MKFMTPIASTASAFFERLRFNFKQKTSIAWVMLGIGILSTIAITFAVKRDIEINAVKKQSVEYDQITLKIQERLEAYALILRGGAALFTTSETVSRDEWRTYINTLRPDQNIPGVQGVGYAQLIPAAKLLSHTKAIRAEGYPDYTVRPIGDRAMYTSIIYLEPFRDRNLRAFGFDMYSEPVRRAAMNQACDSAEAALSGKVELVQETYSRVQPGTLMYVPVYRHAQPTENTAQRRAALIGWVYSPYRMNDLMTGILRKWNNPEGKSIDLHIYDDTQPLPEKILFDSKPGNVTDVHSLLYQLRTIDFNGRKWLLEFNQTTSQTGISYSSAWATLLGGLLISGLLFRLMLSMINTEANAVRMSIKLNAKIIEQTEQLNAIFSLSPDGFVTFDLAHCVKYVSPAFTHLTGLNEILGIDETVFSERLANLCLPSAKFTSLSALRPAKLIEKTFLEEIKEHRQVIELSGAGKRILAICLRENNNGNVSRILYCRDITHETEVEQMKSEFLSTAAHELRTPMASIYGFTELMLARELEPDERHNFLDTIFRQSKLMISIINELLDLARIEARRGKDFNLTKVDVFDLIQEISSGFNMSDNRLAFLKGDVIAPVYAKADIKKLTQAVNNVLSNAGKYSRDVVSIELILPVSHDLSVRDLIGIRIRDLGIGMTHEQLNRVCERFYRADTSGKIPGTGLGMSIVKEIIELHHGKMTIESQLDAGTTVTLWLPVYAEIAEVKKSNTQLLQEEHHD